MCVCVSGRGIFRSMFCTCAGLCSTHFVLYISLQFSYKNIVIYRKWMCRACVCVGGGDGEGFFGLCLVFHSRILKLFGCEISNCLCRFVTKTFFLSYHSPSLCEKDIVCKFAQTWIGKPCAYSLLTCHQANMEITFHTNGNILLCQAQTYLRASDATIEIGFHEKLGF